MKIDLHLINDALGVGFYFGTVTVGFIAALMCFVAIIRLAWAAIYLISKLANRPPKPVKDVPQTPQMELNKKSPYYDRWLEEYELTRNINADKFVPKADDKTNNPS